MQRKTAFRCCRPTRPAGHGTSYASEYCFLQCHLIPPTWILLDSQSTVSVFKNRELLSNIRKSPTALRVHTNGGTQTSTDIGTVANFGDVWFNTNSLANILSMAEVRKIYRITMDTSIEAAMHVHRTDGSITRFKEYKSGLYYFDTAAAAPPEANDTSTAANYIFVQTVAGNKRANT